MSRSITVRGYTRAAALRATPLGFAYAIVVAALVTYYLVVLAWGVGTGVDYACFRAAARLLASGGHPYDMAQLWAQEDVLYNRVSALRPGAPGYYSPEGYYNPPLFAALLTPLARLAFLPGYLLYTALGLLLALVGTLLTLAALGWRRRRLAVAGYLLISPALFLALRNGQQSPLLLFALGAALYALRCERPALAGALLSLGWVKPHLLMPIVVVAPLLLPRPTALRYLAGLATATALELLATVLLVGPQSLMQWVAALARRGTFLGGGHAALPSLAGLSLDLLAPPWNVLVTGGLTLTGFAVMVVVATVRRRQGAGSPWPTLGLLVAVWLLFTPYAHGNDDLLLLLPLAVAMGRDATVAGHSLVAAALLAGLLFPLAIVLPWPWSLLVVAPPLLACVVAVASGATGRVSDQAAGQWQATGPPDTGCAAR